MTAVTASISPSSASAIAAKDNIDAAFRYEKSRPRARTATTVMKGHYSRLSTSSFSKSSSGSGKVISEGGQKGINTNRTSTASVPAGPKSASSRISLERSRREQVKDGHAGHVSRQSSSTSSSSRTPSTSSSNPANAATYANKLSNGHVQHQHVVNGVVPRSSVSGNTTVANSRPDQLSHTSSVGGSASVDIIKAGCNTTSTSSTTPRRVHIAPLRLVNSNATAGREGLNSSSSSRARSATNTLPSSTNWSYGASSGTLSTSTNGPLTGPTYQSSYSHRFEKQPSSALPPISLSAYPSNYIPVNPIPTSAPSYPVQYALQQQRNPSTTPPMSYQAGGDSIQVTIAPRRTSDYTVMQVVHPHYAYSRPMAPLPPASTSTMTSGGTAMSPRFSSGGLTLSQSVPASWNSGGYASRANYGSGISLPPRVGGNGVGGWPAVSVEHSPQYKSPYSSTANTTTGTHYIPPSSPAYRFPLASSTSSSMIPLPWYTPLELSHQYDSMRGSLKRKASLGLVDVRSASRRRSSGESGGSRRGSRSGADKLPPVITRRVAEGSPGFSMDVT